MSGVDGGDWEPNTLTTVSLVDIREWRTDIRAQLCPQESIIIDYPDTIEGLESGIAKGFQEIEELMTFLAICEVEPDFIVENKNELI